jgi:hypothetical protein
MRTRPLRTVCIALIVAGTATNGAQPDSTGIVAGRVFDSKTLEPLLGAFVSIDGTDFGIATDEQGRFQLANVRAGSLALSTTCGSYKDAHSKGTVATGCTTYISFPMRAMPPARERPVKPPVYTGPRNWRAAQMPDDSALVLRIESYFESGRWPDAEYYYAPEESRGFAGFTLYGTVRDRAVTRACGWLVYCTYGIQDGQLVEGGGTAQPIVVLLRDTAVVGTMEVQNGGGYRPSIIRLFPPQCCSLALNNEGWGPACGRINSRVANYRRELRDRGTE